MEVAPKGATSFFAYFLIGLFFYFYKNEQNVPFYLTIRNNLLYLFLKKRESSEWYPGYIVDRNRCSIVHFG